MQSAPRVGSNVCERTYQVRAAIVAKSGADTCAHVTLRHLREITSLDLSNESITSLQAHDFDGLVRLDALDLSGNLLAALPEGVFDELYLLKRLYLDNNLLETLPANLFDELLLLEDLALHDNRLTALPEGMFEDFSQIAGMQANGDPPGNSGSFPRIQRFLDRNGITSRKQFIAAFHGLYKERFSFVNEPEAAAQEPVSYSYPRSDSWGAVGRFIFAWSTDPGAQAMFRDSVEFLRQDETEWRAGVIDFSGPNPRIRELGSSIWVTALEEAGSAFAWRHAEVLFHRLRALDGFRRFAEETVCASTPGSIGARALGVFKESEQNPGLPSPTLQSIQGGRGHDDRGAPRQVQDAVGSALAFLLVFELWRQEPIVRKLYREVSNENGAGPGNFQSSNSLPHDGIGATTAEDELIQLYRLHFGYGDRAALEASRLRNAVAVGPRGHGMDSIDGHIEAMAPRVCETLQATLPRDLRVEPSEAGAVLSWRAPDEDESLNGYQILRGVNGEPPVVHVVNTGAADTTYTDENPAAAENVYAVRAIFDGYPSPDSRWVRLRFGSVPAPGVTGHSSFRLTEGQPAGAQGPHALANDGAPRAASKNAASGDAASEGVCGRTPAVRDAIVSRLEVPCGIAVRRLKEVLELDLSGQSLTALAAGDFDGLHRLRSLDLSDNALATLPAGVFDGLLTLETLRLHDNRLATLPDGLFDKLLTLEELTLHGNGLTELPDTAGMFDDFSPFSGLSLTEEPGPAPGGIAVLRGFLDAHSVESVEEFISALPPAHKKNFVMVYESQGLGAEFISAEHPRMISWGADGKYLFAWITNPEADEPFKSGVEFLIAEGPEWLAGVVDFSGEAPAIKRPESCASCHGGLHKPLWAPGVLARSTKGAQGTEEDARRSAEAWRSTRDLMDSDAPRIAPMNFESSSLKRRDARRPRPFATVAEEFSAAVARQHAEVLFQDLLARSDREAVFRDLLCSPDPLFDGKAAFRIFGSDLLPSFIEKTESHLQHAYSAPSFFYFHFGSLHHALDFRVQHHYWRHREDVRALFAGRSNAGMDGVNNSYLTFDGFPDLRFYPPGTSTMEDELIRAFRHTFGHRAALHVENGETAHRVPRRQLLRSSILHDDYSFPAYRNINHEMQRRVCAYLTSAKLADLSLSGLDIGSFASDRTAYRATAAGVVSTTVAATPADAAANVVIADADGNTAGRERAVSLSAGANRITVTVTAQDGETMTYTVDVQVLQSTGHDRDADRLLEVSSLAQLDAIRHDLDGNGTPSRSGADAYAAAFPGSTAEGWCSKGCRGYELTADLDFDTNGNGTADAGDAYWNDGAGWTPIGSNGREWLSTRGTFRGAFDGNGHRIENLFIHAPEAVFSGLFGSSRGKIRRVAVVHADVTGGTAAGALVGVNRGSVEGCYTTGSVSGSYAGGLAGLQFSGRTRTSFSTARVTGGSAAGGLLGIEKRIQVAASYATGTVAGAAGETDARAGGLVGDGMNGGEIVNGYATGVVAAPRAGGLVGAGGTVTATYWDADSSGLTGSGGRSTSALQGPTDYDGIYQDWNSDLDDDGDNDDPWDFGTAGQYPALSVDFDGDGQASWHEFGYQLRSGPALMATADAGTVALAWTAVKDGYWDPRPEISYAVWRDHGTTREIVAEDLSALEYTDAEVVTGETYRYQVIALVEGGEAARSAWAEVEAQAGSGQATVSITADTASAAEGSAVSFTVARTGPAADVLVVNVSVSETGAMTSSPPASLTLEAGQDSGALTVETTDDAVVEADSTVTARLAAGDGYALGDPAFAAVTISDNDEAAFAVEALPEEIAEGDSAAVTVSITNGVTFSEDQTISLKVSGTAVKDTDYTLSAEELTLSADASSVAVTVAALADEVKEEGETVDVTASHGGESVGTATVTITAGEASDDATLSVLALSAVDFGTFASDTTAYTASVGYDVKVTTVTATTTDEGAGFEIAPEDTDGGTEGHQVELGVGETPVTVTVTAEDGTTQQSYTVTVTRAAAPPEVTGTTAFTVTEGETAVGTLTASDEDTEAEDLAWSLSGGADAAAFALTPAGVLSLVSAKDYEAPDDAGADGTYNITVQVSDGTNNVTAAVTVTLGNRNEAPTADAGSDQTGVEGGATVTLSGTGEDPDAGETLVYAWTQTAGTTVTLATPSAATTTFRAPADLAADEGLTFRLTVTDGGGLTAEDEVTVTVEKAAPLSKPTNLRMSGLTHDAVTLTWDAPAGVEVAGYQVLIRDKDLDPSGVFRVLVENTGSTATTYRVTGLEPERRYVFRVKAHTADGRLTPRSRWLDVDTPAAPAPPEVTGTTAFTVTEGETAVGTLTATDEDTPAGDLAWSITGGSDRAHFRLSTAGVLAFAAAKDYEAPDDTGADGTYNITVQVSDGTNNVTAAVTVTLGNRNEAPTADAGSDQTGVEGGATVTLSGTGEDPDAGETLAYAWTQTGGATVTLSSASSAVATFTAPSNLSADETLTFRLRVTDGGGLTADGSVRVTVAAASVPAAPEVTGTTAFTVTEGETAVGTLTASDEDTEAEDLAWSLSGGADAAAFALTPAGVLSLVSAKDYEAPDDAGADGTYNITVQVSDGTNNVTAAVTVTLGNRNEVPTADAGSDQTGVEGGATVTLSGTGEDPDAGETLVYAWTQTAGTTVTLATPSAATTTFRAPADLAADEGLTFRLTVTDGGGLTAEDEVTVTVEKAAPLSKPTNLRMSGLTHDAVTLTWDAPAGVEVAGYQVLIRDKDLDPSGVFRVLVENTGSTATTYRVTGLEPERRYVFRVKAHTADGRLTPRSRWLDVDTPAAPAPPEVTGTTAFTVTEGETAVGTLTATDEDTPAGDLAWSITGGSDRAHFRLSTAGVLAFAAAKDYEAPDDTGADGTYNITVQVSDGTNNVTAAVTVTLGNRNEAPTADAGSDQTGVEGGATVTLSGTGEDPDAGETLAYAWTQTAGTTVTLATPSAATTTFRAPRTWRRTRA